MTTGEQDEWKAVLVGAMSYYTKGSEHLGLADMAEHVRRLERENRQMRDKAALADELLSNYDVDALKLGDVSCDYCGAELQREPHRVLDKWMADRPELIGLMCPVARYNAIEEEDK